jgi:hypothetical protein
MRKQQAKTVNQTFSLPIEVSEDLHTYIKRREMSRFVSDLLREGLEAKKRELRQSYLDANEDEGQLETMKDWEGTLADGTDEW